MLASDQDLNALLLLGMGIQHEGMAVNRLLVTCPDATFLLLLCYRSSLCSTMRIVTGH